jgi:CheY-like chemotaxis protein
VKKILVVDDEAVVRTMLVRLLERSGYDVIEAESAPEVLPAIEANDDVSLVICDLNLAGASGTDLLESVRARYPELPIVLVTGAAYPWQVEAATRVGVRRVLFKPFSHAELLGGVAEELAATTGRRDLEVEA